MAKSILTTGLLFALSSYANAQFGRPDGDDGGYSSGNNPYESGDGSDSGFGGDFGGEGFGDFARPNHTMLAAHAILATVAFGLLFPSGSILIRLGSFRGLWLVHGLFQLFAYLLYIAAFAMGIYMVKHMPSNLGAMHDAHPIIGIILFVLLLFQPILGFVHHFAFKKYNRRVVWSYGHLWLGRIVITAGIVNGGLGLRLAKRIGMFAPTQSQIIGYSVAAGVMWLLYVAAAIYGERKRSRSRAAAIGTAPPPYKREGASSSEEGVQYA